MRALNISKDRPAMNRRSKVVEVILLLLLGLLLPVGGFGQSPGGPALTTIKDTVYKSDGSPATGSVVISWDSYLSQESKPIFGGTKTVTLNNGNLLVALIPNLGATPAGTSYTVRYYQSGSVYAEEFWVVPNSSPTLPPNQPTVVQVGASGSTTSCYWISAVLTASETNLSPGGCTSSGHNSPSTNNFNRVSWTAVTGALSYRVFRTPSNTAPVGTGLFLVTTTTALTVDVQSSVLQSATVPEINTTDTRSLQQVRVAVPPAQSLSVAPSQVTGNAIVSAPLSTQTITAPASSGTPLQIRAQLSNNANLLNIFDSPTSPTPKSSFNASGAFVSSVPPILSTFSSGSLLFAGSGGQISESNSQLFWDSSSDRLRVGPRSGLSTLMQGSLDIYKHTFTLLNPPAGFTASLGALSQSNNAASYNVAAYAVSESNHSSGNRSGSIALEADAYHTGAGTISDLQGIFAFADNSAPAGGNASRVTALGANAWHSGNATTDEMSALRIYSNGKSGGTVTNNYGLRIDDQAAGANNWAIKTGLGKVEFGGPLAASRINNVRFADQFTGTDAGAKIIAAMADLPSTGGTVDARGLEGSQTISADMFNGVAKPVTLLLGAATYNLSATQNIPNNVAVIGAGRGSTVLDWTGALNGTALNIGTAVSNVNVRSLKLTTGQAGTTKAINVAKGVDILLEDLEITGNSCASGFNIGVNVTGDGGSDSSNNVTLMNSRVVCYTGFGVAVDHAIQTHLTNLEIASAANNTSYIGLLLDSGVSGLFVEGVSVSYGLHGFVIQDTERGGSGAAPVYLFFSEFLSDTTSGGDGILFDSSLGASYIGATFTDCWSAGSGRSDTGTQVTPGAVGVRISGGRQIFFQGGKYRSNDADGFKIDSSNVRDVWIRGANITENNQANGADAHGIYVSAAAANISILENNVSNLPSGNMRYGVKVAAVAADELHITGNDFTNLGTGDVSNSNTADYLIADNKPNPSFQATGSGNWQPGFNYAGTTQIVKGFSTPHAAGNVPSGLNLTLNDGAVSGMLIRNVRDGSFNSQSIELATGHGGVSAGTRMTIDKDGLTTFAVQAASPIFSSTAGDPADTGTVRLGNNETIAAESAPTGTDGTLKYNSSNQWELNSPIAFEGATVDGNKTVIAVVDATAVRTFTIPNADSNPVQPATCSGTDKVSAISSSGVITCSADQGGSGSGGDNVRVEDGDNAGTFTAMNDVDFDDSGDIDFQRAAGSPDSMIGVVRSNSVALTTDTTGNYVASVADGTGIDGTASGEGATYTPTLDLTEINSHTFGDNTTATLTQTFDPTGATNPAWSYSNGTANLSTGTLQQGGTAVALQSVTLTAGNGLTGGGDISASRTFDVAVTSPIEISSDTVACSTCTTASNSQSLTNKTFDAEGTGNVLVFPQKIEFQAAGCDGSTAASAYDLPTANAPSKSCQGTSPHRFGTLDFADGASALTANVRALLPSDWTSTGGVDLKYIWSSASTSTNSVVWTIQTACVADGEDVSNPTYNTAQTVSDANNSTANTRNSASISGITMTGCAAGESLFLKIGRDPTNASDTLAATALLHSLEITIRRQI